MTRGASWGAMLALAWITSTAAFEGQVVDPAGRPLPGARVTVAGSRASAVADAEGRFALEPDPPLPLDLMVTRSDGVALRPVRLESLPDSGAVVIRLEGILAESVTVLSGLVPDLEMPPAAAATVLGRGDLEMRLPPRLADAVASVPGSGRSEAGLSAVPSLRGLSRARTLILLDEGRVSAERRAGPSATFLDPETLDEVEIVRGPGTVAYGSDALGGIVRAKSRMPVPGSPPSLRLVLGAGTDGSGNGGVVEYAAPVGDGAILAGGSARSFADYDSPSGTVPNSSGHERGARVAYQSPFGAGTLRIHARGDFGRDIGKPSTDWPDARAFYPEEDSYRAGVAYERPGPGAWARLAWSASWDDYRLVTRRDRYAEDGSPVELGESDVDARDYGARIEAERAVRRARLLVGADASGRYGLRAVNRTTTFDEEGRRVEGEPEVSIDSARRDDGGLFAVLSGRPGATSLAVGARADRILSRTEGGYFGDRSTSRGAISGFLSAGWTLARGLDVTLQAARGFREALLSDRYYRGISGRGYVTGNPELAPETSLQYDAAVRLSRGRVGLAAFGYVYRIRDVIDRVKADPSRPDDYVFRNLGDADLEGIEIEGTVDAGRGISVEVGGQMARGETRGDRTPLNDVPPAGAWVTVRRDRSSRWWWLARASAFRRDGRPGPAERDLPGYAVLDADVGLRLGSRLTIGLTGRNLLDRSYPGSADAKAVPAPGRSLLLTLRGAL